MDEAVGSQHTVVIDGEGLPHMVGDPASRLGHQELAGCYVPWLELALPVPVQPPGRHVGKVKGRGPGASYRPGRHLKVKKIAEVILVVPTPVVWKPCGEQAVLQRLPPGDPERCAVQ